MAKMKKYIMLPEDREAICSKLEEIFDHATAKSITETFDELNMRGVPNGAFQDYYLLSLLFDLQSKIIAVKRSLEARYSNKEE